MSKAVFYQQLFLQKVVLQPKKVTMMRFHGWASQNGRTTRGGTAQETVVTDYAQLKAALQNTAVKGINASATITVPAITEG